MKTLRGMAIIFAGLIVANMQAAEYYNKLQNLYQAAKDPVQRAALLQRMQDARIAAQQNIEAGLTTAREIVQDPALRAAAIKNFTNWVDNNKRKIIAATTALVAITGTIAAVALTKENRDSILNVFRKNGINLSNTTFNTYCLELGKVAKNGTDALMEAINKLDSKSRETFLFIAKNSPGFIESLAQLAGLQSAELLKEKLGV